MINLIWLIIWLNFTVCIDYLPGLSFIVFIYASHYPLRNCTYSSNFLRVTVPKDQNFTPYTTKLEKFLHISESVEEM